MTQNQKTAVENAANDVESLAMTIEVAAGLLQLAMENVGENDLRKLPRGSEVYCGEVDRVLKNLDTLTNALYDYLEKAKGIIEKVGEQLNELY